MRTMFETEPKRVDWVLALTYYPNWPSPFTSHGDVSPPTWEHSQQWNPSKCYVLVSTVIQTADEQGWAMDFSLLKAQTGTGREAPHLSKPSHSNQAWWSRGWQVLQLSSLGGFGESEAKLSLLLASKDWQRVSWKESDSPDWFSVSLHLLESRKQCNRNDLWFFLWLKLFLRCH